MTIRMKTALLVALILAVAGATMLGVVTHRPLDRGFMTKACGPAGRGEVWWSRTALPLTYRFDVGMSPRWKKAVRGAVSRWEKEVGATIFQEMPPGQFLPHDVLVGEHPGEDKGTTQLFWEPSCEVHFARVGLPTSAPPEALHAVAVHELGHVLLLDHDMRLSSIMLPVFAGGDRFEITEADKERLRQWLRGSRRLQKSESSTSP